MQSPSCLCAQVPPPLSAARQRVPSSTRGRPLPHSLGALSWARIPSFSLPDRDNIQKSESVLFYDWRFAANQFTLASSPLRLPTRFFFHVQLNPILSDEKVGLSLTNMLGPLSNIHTAHIGCYWKFFLLHYVQVLCQSRLCKADHASLHSLCYNGSLVTWNGRKLDHRQV
jgi:hypothetical protein